MTDTKEMLHRYLRDARESVLWKVDGLSERDLRWPHTPTGTNLLGLVKHLSGIELDYFGEVFDRPAPWTPAWVGAEEVNADMWATADEPAADVVDLYRRACAHADATITALDLDAPGRVPWWGDTGRPVTLQRILVHVIAETARHAGHLDIIREQTDGAAGLWQRAPNLPSADAQWWQAYVARLRRIADGAGG